MTNVVRPLARSTLESRGYKVLAARDGNEALLASLRHEGPIDLIFTDVVMLHLSGRELVERLAPERPGMKVLYTSAYTDDGIVRQGLLASRGGFLQKPYTPNILLRVVREALGPPPEGAAGRLEG